MNDDESYYRYLQTSEVSSDIAERHREILAEYYWNIFRRYECRKVLDVGCGLGFFVSKAPVDAQAVGVDANRKVVEHCRAAGLAVLQGTAERLPVPPPEPVDGIMCGHLLEHVAEPEPVFREFARVLREGGILIVRVPPFGPSFYDDWTHVRPYTARTLARLAASSGFEILSVHHYRYGYPFRRWRNPLFRALNGVRRLPAVRAIADALLRAYGLPPKELVLIARKQRP